MKRKIHDRRLYVFCDGDQRAGDYTVVINIMTYVTIHVFHQSTAWTEVKL